MRPRHKRKVLGHPPRVGKKICSDEGIAIPLVKRNKVIGGGTRNTYGIDFRDHAEVVSFSR